jgi:uncharacterized protein YkwD
MAFFPTRFGLRGDLSGRARTLAPEDQPVQAADGTLVLGTQSVLGTNEDDVLTGIDGRDRIKARNGDDLLIDTAGADDLDGGRGYDTAFFAGSRSDYTVEQSGRRIKVTRDGETDKLRNIEELQFGSDPQGGENETFVVADGGFFDEPAARSGRANSNRGERINGTNDDDILAGGDGNDRMNGRRGDDVLVNSAGDDNMNGGSGNDAAFFTGALSDYTVEFVGNRIRISDGTGTDTLTSIEELLFGQSPDDTDLTSFLVTDSGLIQQVPAPSPVPAPSESDPPPPEPTQPPQADTPEALDAFEAEVLRLVNEFRADNGLPPLQSDSRLNAAADDWSQTMAEDDFFAHSTPAQVEEQNYDWRAWGENIAAGQQTPESVVNAWINSPGHRANMLSENYQDIGIGYYYLQDDTGSVNYHHYWTQAFGTEFGDAIA